MFRYRVYAAFSIADRHLHPFTNTQGIKMLVYVFALTLLVQPSPSMQHQKPKPELEQAAPAEVDPADGSVWGNTEVANYLRTFGPDRNVEEDPFVNPTAPTPAENIVLAVPISAYQDWLSTYWTYDRNAQTMTVVATEDDSAAAGAALVNESPPQTALTMRGWALTARRSPPVMEFYGNRQLPVRTLHVTGFGQVQATRIPGPRPAARVFRHTFSIEPEAARALSAQLELRVSGKAVPWRDGQRTLCVTDRTEMGAGTVVRSCFLTGMLETYQIIDKRDGSMIHEWDAR